MCGCMCVMHVYACTGVVLIAFWWNMKKSLFRLVDIFELLVIQLACFIGNSLFDYANSLGRGSYIWSLFNNIKDYRAPIVAASTIIVIVCYYQFLCKKKVEVHCRILVGDSLTALSIRYALTCLGILGASYGVAILIDKHFQYSLGSNFYLFCLLIMYVVISATQLRKYRRY